MMNCHMCTGYHKASKVHQEALMDKSLSRPEFKSRFEPLWRFDLTCKDWKIFLNVVNEA